MVVVWTTLRADFSDSQVFQQRYSASGMPLSQADQLVNVTAAGEQYDLKVTGLSDGGWVVTWGSPGQDGNGRGIFQQRFNNAGVALSPADLAVNITTTDDQVEPATTALSDGGWVVTWTSDNQDGDAGGSYQQRFDKHGVAASAVDMLVDTVITDNQYEPSVSALVDGGWIVTWTSYLQDGSGFGVFQKLAKKAFWVGTASHDKDDRVIYDKKKGVLFYDPDGTGHAAAVQIVKMSTKLKMTFADVFVI